MLEAGLELLADRGLSIGMDTVRFDDVIIKANAPRASAYRAWSDPESEIGPQVRFHDEVAAHILRDWPSRGTTSSITRNTTLAAVQSVLSELPDPPSESLAKMSPQERGAYLRRMVRVGGETNQEALDSSPLWFCYLAIMAGLRSMKTDHVPDELDKAWRDGAADQVENYLALYQSVADLFGYRLRAPYSWEQFGLIATAMVEGLTMRSRVNAELLRVERATGPDGATEHWTLFAIGMEGLVKQFMEPDPDAPYSTVLEHETYE